MTTIRPMQPADKEAVLAMMEVFYASPAVLSNGSAAIFSSDFEACINARRRFGKPKSPPFFLPARRAETGAASRNRTGTVSLPADFKSAMSTDFIMAAYIPYSIISARPRQV